MHRAIDIKKPSTASPGTRHVTAVTTLIFRLLNVLKSTMPVLNESASFLVSTIVSILLFSGMQMGKALLTSTPTFTIVGGFIGSILFVFLLTAISNLEKTLFGNNFQTKLGESRFCLLVWDTQHNNTTRT